MSLAMGNGRDTVRRRRAMFSQTEHESRTASGLADRTQACWKVTIRPSGDKIIREIEYENKPWDAQKEGWEAEGVIWPAWPTDLQDQAALASSPLAGAQDYWAGVSSRLRDSAKWMATVLGAALAAIVGTSPLVEFTARHPRGWAIMIGLGGIFFLYLTLFLILQVMRPQSVSYADVQAARGLRQRSLQSWQKIVESEEDLYLPCGVKCLTSLRQSMIIEEVTLGAIARARITARDHEASQILSEAEAARSARLMELRTACSRIATIGEYYKLRARSTRATYLGTASSMIGTVAIITAFAWPSH